MQQMIPQLKDTYPKSLRSDQTIQRRRAIFGLGSDDPSMECDLSLLVFEVLAEQKTNGYGIVTSLVLLGGLLKH